MLGTDAILVDLLHQGHDKLAFFNNGVVLAVALHHIHGVQPVPAPCGHMDHCADVAAHCLHHWGKFPFGVTDQNVVLGIENQESNQFFRRKRFAGTRDAQNKGRLV